MRIFAFLYKGKKVNVFGKWIEIFRIVKVVGKGIKVSGIAHKGPSRLDNPGELIIFLILSPKDPLWCQYAIPRVPEILLTKKRINHRF